MEIREIVVSRSVGAGDVLVLYRDPLPLPWTHRSLVICLLWCLCFCSVIIGLLFGFATAYLVRRLFTIPKQQSPAYEARARNCIDAQRLEHWFWLQTIVLRCPQLKNGDEHADLGQDILIIFFSS